MIFYLFIKNTSTLIFMYDYCESPSKMLLYQLKMKIYVSFVIFFSVLVCFTLIFFIIICKGKKSEVANSFIIFN